MKSRIIVTLIALCFFVVSQAQEAPFTRNINQEGLRALDLMNNSDLTFARESGPLVLTVYDVGGWGDISYAKAVAEIVNHHRPDIDIKIIIVRSQKPLSKIKNFFSGIEGISEISNTVLEIDIENLIEKNISSPSTNWLKSASLIIQLSNCPPHLKSLKVPYICLNEIGSEHENNTYTTLKSHINYARKWSRKLGIKKKLPREQGSRTSHNLDTVSNYTRSKTWIHGPISSRTRSKKRECKKDYVELVPNSKRLKVDRQLVRKP